MKSARARMTLWVIVLLPLFAVSAVAGVINSNIIASADNLENDLQLTAVPLNVTENTDEIVLQWAPAVEGTLHYAIGTPGYDPAFYEPYTGPRQSSPGRLEINAEDMGVIGWLTCFISAGEDTSSFFNLIIASPTAPSATYPRSAADGEGIDSYTPIFTWDPVPDVPYYQVILADQPFTIEEDEEGTRVEGANIIWTVITPETEIQYGVPDPSGVINNPFVPPLIGADNDHPEQRPRYNWLVLNNYGNHPGFTSTVTGGIVGFEVGLPAPFDRPENTTPLPETDILGGDIRFVWTDIEEAISYFIYVSRYEISNGSSATILVWSDQTTTNTKTCPAPNYLENARYVWKIMAVDAQGRGTMSDTTSFNYITEAGHLTIRTRDNANNILAFSDVDFTVVEGPAIMPVLTDDQGSYDREIPVGTYIPIAHKENYADAIGDTVVIEDEGNVSVTMHLAPLPFSLSGQVVDDAEEPNPVGNAIIIATDLEDNEQETITNINGEFSLSLPVGTWEIIVEKDGYETSEPRTVTLVAGDNPNLDLNLPENGGRFVLSAFTFTLSGYVLNRNQEPISNATVRAENDNRSFSDFTADDGFYSFTLGNDTWTLTASRPGFYLESGPQNVVIAGGNETANITLAPQAVVISGQVIPQGLDGLRILANPELGGVVQEAVPTDNGYYSMGVEPGSYRVRGVLDGYTSNEVQLVLQPGDPPGIANITMTVNSSTVSGNVQDPDGNRIPAATVTSGGVEVTTNQIGAYSIDLLPGSHELTASKPDYTTSTVGPFDLGFGEEVTDVVIVLNPNSATVNGRVTVGGVGLPGATVLATPQDGGDPVSVITRESGRNVQPGTFELGLDPGSYVLTASKEGFINIAPAEFELLLEPNAEVERNFALQQYISTISGNATSRGEVLPGVDISLVPLEGEEIHNRHLQMTGELPLAGDS